MTPVRGGSGGGVAPGRGRGGPVTLAAWARSRGIPVSTAHKAAQAGRIDRLPDGRVDPLAADAAWAARTRWRIGGHLQGNGHADGAFTAARTAREAIHARMLQLQLERRQAQLVPAADVEAAKLVIRDRVAAALAALPELADRIAPAGQREAVHQLLQSEVARIIGELELAQRQPAPRRVRGTA